MIRDSKTGLYWHGSYPNWRSFEEGRIFNKRNHATSSRGPMMLDTEELIGYSLRVEETIIGKITVTRPISMPDLIDVLKSKL